MRPLQAVDVPRANELEVEGYPSVRTVIRPISERLLDGPLIVPVPTSLQDEAASLEGMKYRQSVAPQFFLGLYKDMELGGFVNGTSCMGSELHHETMSR